MSRSFKRYPICKQQADKDMKRFANKKVRHTLDLPNGKAYKKCFESWSISDWHYLWTEDEAIREWEEYEHNYSTYHSLEEFLNHWKKRTIRK